MLDIRGCGTGIARYVGVRSDAGFALLTLSNSVAKAVVETEMSARTTMRVRTEIEASIRANRLSGCERSMERMQLVQSRRWQEHCAALSM